MSGWYLEYIKATKITKLTYQEPAGERRHGDYLPLLPREGPDTGTLHHHQGLH